jgi:biopolymer transport protein ExbD
MAGGGDSGPAFSPSPMMAQFATFMPRRPMGGDSNFDITAMIDLVFMMNIFFLVTSLTKSNSAPDLPTASFCVPADESECVVISVVSGKDPENPVVFIAGESADKGISDQQEQQDEIVAAVEKGVAEKKNKVLIKAEKNILVRHIVRLSSSASAVEGTQTLFAVMEVDKKE